MTTCFSEKYGVYHNDSPIDGDSVIQDKPFDGPGDYIDGLWVAVPMPVPASVTIAQAQAALYRGGLLDQVQAAVDAAVASGDVETGIFWRKANSVERHSAFVSKLATALGLTDKQIDDLFMLADSIG